MLDMPRQKMNNPKKYRESKIIEAILWDGDADTANAFIGEVLTDWRYTDQNHTDGPIYVKEVDGNTERVGVGEYLCKLAGGYWLAYDSKIFESMFEEIKS